MDDDITWSDTVEGAFHRICSILSHCNKNGLVFNPNKFRFTRREVKFTGYGILKQKTCECKKVSPTCCPNGWRLVLARGAFCKPAERNYSPIEGEATAILKCLQHTKHYTLGCKSLHVTTDHQSLVTTLGMQSVADVPNKRLARIKEKIMCWKFNMIYNPVAPSSPDNLIESGPALLCGRPLKVSRDKR